MNITYSISMLSNSTADEKTPSWYNKMTLILHLSKHSESDWHSNQQPWQMYSNPESISKFVMAGSHV